MGIYRDLCKSPGVVRLLTSQLIARLPFGMFTIAIILHIEHRFHNYSSAGAVLAAISIGQAVSGPVTSRLMGRFGIRPVILVTSTVCALSFAAIALAPLELPPIIAIAAVAGLSMPPITSAVRTIYPKIVPGNLLSGLYSMDATAQEIIWVCGPVLSVFISVQIAPDIGVLVSSAIIFGGGVLFTITPEIGKVRIPRSRRSFGAVLSRPTVWLATVLGFLYIAYFAALETGVVAIFGHESFDGGIALACNAVGSFIGGFLIGHRPLTPFAIPLRFAACGFGTAMCLFSGETWWLCLSLLLSGLGSAPAFAALSALISSTVKFSDTSEAFGWSMTGQLVGAALGATLAGVAVDHFGQNGAFVVALCGLGLAILVSIAAFRIVPDLRGKDASPIADTEKITVLSQAIS
ncbi:MAG: MFS transporter [Microbacteriaceae bacterium]|nr:MFS transporter [Microbacteriaceae bacterium]